MDLSKLAAAATIVEAGAVIFSLCLILWQLKQQTKVTKASNMQSIIEMSTPITTALLESPRLTEVWHNGYRDYVDFTYAEQVHYRYLIGWWLTYFENIYQQNRSGMFDEVMYEVWMTELKAFIWRRNVAMHWSSFEKLYEYKYRDHVSELVYEELKARDRGEKRPEIVPDWPRTPPHHRKLT